MFPAGNGQSLLWGQRSFADRHKMMSQFEGVLARPALPANSEALDDQLDDVAEDAGYHCATAVRSKLVFRLVQSIRTGETFKVIRLEFTNGDNPVRGPARASGSGRIYTSTPTPDEHYRPCRRVLSVCRVRHGPNCI